MSGFLSLFLDPGAQAQFIHRLLALLILILTFYIFAKSKKNGLSKLQQNSLYILPIIVSGQFILGIATLIMAAPIFPCTSTSSFGILLASVISF